jgi:antitoxin ParD1/3/4
MSIHLTPDLEAVIRQKVKIGLYSSADEALREAVRLLDERDRRLEWLRAELAVGEEQEKRGELVGLTPQRFAEIKRRARENARQGKPIKDAVKP